MTHRFRTMSSPAPPKPLHESVVPKLRKSEQAILDVLLSTPSGYLNASNAEMSELTGFHVHTVESAKASLKARGMIRTKRPPSGPAVGHWWLIA